MIKAFVSVRKQLTLTCGGSFAMTFILKSQKLEAEGNLLWFYGKTIEKAKNMAKLTI